MTNKSRRKILLLLRYETPAGLQPDKYELAYREVCRGTRGQEAPPGRPRAEFLIGREKDRKGLGFPEVVLEPGETVSSALQRKFPWLGAVMPQKPECVAQFRHDGWDIAVVTLPVHRDQRFASGAEQAFELPFPAEWRKADWLDGKREDDLLNALTGHAVAHRAVQDYLRSFGSRQPA